jgi:hypothetical protein
MKIDLTSSYTEIVSPGRWVHLPTARVTRLRVVVRDREAVVTENEAWDF